MVANEMVSIGLLDARITLMRELSLTADAVRLSSALADTAISIGSVSMKNFTALSAEFLEVSLTLMVKLCSPSL